MSRFINRGVVLNLSPESVSPVGANAGPHVMSHTNNMYLSGGVQGRFGGLIAQEPWGPTLDDGTVFTHELGHTAAGFSVGDPLNVALSENLYRGWVGTPPRSDYGILSRGQASQPVPSRSLWDQLVWTW